MKKKKTRRDNVKNPALKKQYNSKVRQEYMDYDYLDQLSEEEKAWLDRFTAEELNANLKHKGEKLNDVDDKENRKRIYDANNARNRCVYGLAKAARLLDSADNEIISEALEPNNVSNENVYEDALIDYLDNKTEKD